MPKQSENNDCANILTNAQSLRSIVHVRLTDIDDGLQLAYKDAFERLSAIHDEQRAIQSHYSRYRDLIDEAKRYETRIKRIAGALQHHAEKWPQKAEIVTGYGKDFFDEIKVAVQQESISLWEVITAILEQTGEIQVIELENVLDFLGFVTTRSAIESALKTHPKEFRVRMSGRNKFISLKGA